MPENDLALLDRKLLEEAANGWTGEQMQEAHGIPAAQAIVRVRELLTSFDVWEEHERRKLLMLSAYKIKEQIENAIIDTDKPKETEAYLKVISTLSTLLDKQSKISTKELETITRTQARELLRLVEAGYSRARDLLLEEYGMLVDVAIIDEAFQVGMREALISNE